MMTGWRVSEDMMGRFWLAMRRWVGVLQVVESVSEKSGNLLDGEIILQYLLEENKEQALPRDQFLIHSHTRIRKVISCQDSSKRIRSYSIDTCLE